MPPHSLAFHASRLVRVRGRGRGRGRARVRLGLGLGLGVQSSEFIIARKEANRLGYKPYKPLPGSTGVGVGVFRVRARARAIGLQSGACRSTRDASTP